MLLEKILQSQGFGSRKQCQQLIKQGAVSIHDQVQTNPKQQIDVNDLTFYVFNKRYDYREKVYIALNKPQGYECSHRPQHHQSVFSLVPAILLERGLTTVGRLDQDTTGLLLLSDDGQFVHALTHPKRHVAKIYWVTTLEPVTPELIEALKAGVSLHQETDIFIATDIQQMSEYQLSLTIHRGVYHQVKRMIAAAGNQVKALHRHQVGALSLPHLAEGDWIYLNAEQIQAVQHSVD